MAGQNEKNTEKYLREQVEKLGGRAYKWISPGNLGVPDRICLFPFGLIVFVEVKAEGKTVVPNSPQARRLTEINRFGFIIAVVDTKAKVDYIIDKVRTSLLDLTKIAQENLVKAKAEKEVENGKLALRDT